MSEQDWDNAYEVVADGSDPTDLMEGPAAAVATLDPPYPAYPTFRGPPWMLDTTDEQPLEPGVVVPPDAIPRVLRRTVVEEAAQIVEAAVFRSEAHPRWPKGSGKRAGEFMEVGQLFTSSGKTWQIANIVNGRIYAHEASGSYHAAETKAFNTSKDAEGKTVVPGIAYHAPVVPKGGKGHGSTVVVVDPAVDSASHDPSIPVPEHSSLSAEQWARFGKADQEHYIELMERFGSHKGGHAQKLVNDAYKAAEDAVRGVVEAGYSEQYGASSGYSLSIAAGKAKDVTGTPEGKTAKTKGSRKIKGHGVVDTPEFQALREKALALQAEHAAAVHWDLYNRTLSPDVLTVHKSQNWSAKTWHDTVIAGDTPAFSGLSQSYNYRKGWWASKGVMMPLAIRHVLMATQSAHASPSAASFKSEFEVSAPQQLKLTPDNALAFEEHGTGQLGLTATEMTWLEGMTNQPASGQLFHMLMQARKTGAKLPIPPQPPSIQMDHAGGKTWTDPPPEGAKPTGFDPSKMPKIASTAYEAGTLDKSIPWAFTDDDGTPKATVALDSGLKPGDYMMGLKGTLYMLIPDAGDPSGFGLRYAKIVDGEFTGESYTFEGGGANKYFKLDPSVSFDWNAWQKSQAEPGDEPLFDATKWGTTADSKLLEDYEPGEKFKVAGIPYEVTGAAPGGHVAIKSLDDGATGKINGTYKSPWLVPVDQSADSGLTQAKQLAVGDHVIVSGDEPGFKGVVTGLGADSDGVQVHPFGAAEDHPGVVVGPGSVTEVHPITPSKGVTFAHVKSNYTQPGGMSGDLPHGTKYTMAVGSPKIYTRGVDDGEGTAPAYLLPAGAADGVHGAKATVTKILADGTIQANKKPGMVQITPEEWASTYGKSAYDPAAHVIGGKVKLRDLSPGDKFHGSAGQQTHRPYEVIQQVTPGAGGKTTVVRNLDTGEVTELSAHKSYAVLTAKAPDAVPDDAAKTTPEEPAGPGAVGPQWDPGKFVLGDQKVKITDADVGSYLLGAGGHGAVLKVTGQSPTHATVTWVTGESAGSSFQATKSDAGLYEPLSLYVPKDDSAPLPEPLSVDEPPAVPSDPLGDGFDPSSYVEGVKTKIGLMPPGTVFKTDSKYGPKYYQLSEDGQHTTNLQTGKVYEAKPHFKATPMQPGEQPQPEGALTTHAHALGDIKPGTHVEMPGGHHAVVVSHGKGLSAGTTYVAAPGMGDVKGVPVPSKTMVRAWAPTGDVGNDAEAANAQSELIDSLEHDLKGLAVNDSQSLGNGVVVHRVPKGWRVVTGPTDHGTFYAEAGNAAHAAFHAEPGGKSQLVGDMTWSKGDTFTLAAPAVAQTEAGTDEAGHLPTGTVLTAVSDKATAGGGGKFLTADGQTVGLFNGHKLVPADAPPHAGNPHTTSPLGSNAKGKSFGELKVGAVFSPAHNGIKLRKTGVDSASPAELTGQISEPQTFAADYVPDDLHSEPLGEAHIGSKVTAIPDPEASPSLKMTSTQTGYVQKIRPADGAVQLYGSARWHKPQHVTVHDEQLPPLAGGTKVALEDGTQGWFVGYSAGQNGEPQADVDLTGNMDVVGVSPWAISETGFDDGTGAQQTGTPLAPKASNPTPYEQLTQGDATPLGALKPGDQFKVDSTSNTIIEVVKPADPAVEAGNVGVTIPGATGQFAGVVHSIAPGAPVVLHAKAEDVAAVEEPPAAVEPDDLPDAISEGGMVPFTAPAGGDQSFHQIGAMPGGTIFEDKGGHVWKVKVAGNKPVVTGGAAHFKVTPAARGKALTNTDAGTEFIDTSGPVGGGYDAGPSDVIAAEADLVPNTSGKTLGQMNLKPGDYVRLGEAGSGAGRVHEYVAHQDGGWVTLQDVETGQQRVKSAGHVPSHVSPGAHTPPPDADLPGLSDVAPPPSLFTEATTLGEVPEGGKFTFAPGSQNTLTKISAGPSLSSYSSGQQADYLQAPHDRPVYVQPTPTSSAALTAAVPASQLVGGDVISVPDAHVDWAEVVSVAPASDPAFPGELDVQVRYSPGAPISHVFLKPTDQAHPPVEPAAASVPAQGYATPPPKPPGEPAAAVVDGPHDFAPPAPVPAVAASVDEDVLDPFGSRLGPGGVYRHEQIGTLQLGQLFTDKSGAAYRVVAQGAGHTIYEDVATGQQHSTPHKNRVKLTALPPHPGPQLKPVINDLVAKYGSLESVPELPLSGFDGTYAHDGKAKRPRIGHLKYGDVAYDAAGHQIVFLGSWVNRALVLDGMTNEPRLADARLRVATQQP